jgi:A/G-specific adenine glycosylase
MRQCGPGERWAGLWDFPRFGIEGEGPLFALEEIVTKVREQTGVTCAAPKLLSTMRHGVTRYRITLDCYEARYENGRARAANNSAVRWVPSAELPALPLSTTGRKLAKLIN